MSQPNQNRSVAVPSRGGITELPNTKARDAGAIALDAVLGHGDLSLLSAEERAFHYVEVCRSLGLNPKTQPFEYVAFQGRLVLYPRKNAADQLGAQHRVTFPDEPVQEVKTLGNSQMLVTKMRGVLPDGRQTWDMSTIFLGNMSGQELANQFMKGITKCRRRVILALVGLGGDVPVDLDNDRPLPGAIRESGSRPELTPQEIAAYATVSDPEEPEEAIEVEADDPAPAAPPDEVPASDKARKAFFAVCRDREIGEDDQKALVWMWYGHTSRKDLTEEEARVSGTWIKNASLSQLAEAIMSARDAVKERDAGGEDAGEIVVESTDESAEERTFREFIEQLDAATTKRATAQIAKDYNKAQAEKRVPADRATMFFSALNEKNRDIEQAGS